MTLNVEYVKDDKVLRGRNGRLFVAADSNDVLRQHAGDLLLSAEQLDQWDATMRGRVERLAEMGVPYFYVIPPNSHSVFPEDLPEGVGPLSPVRPVTQLLERLGPDFEDRVFYPLELLRAAKQEGQLVYSKADSHWSNLGAYLTFRELAGRIAPRVDMDVPDPANIIFTELEAYGDLGFKLDPMESAPSMRIRVERPRARLVSDNGLLGVGTLITTACEEAAASSCIVFGDSFAHAMLQSIAASFRRMVFAQLHYVDYELVARERPNVVLGVLNERFLIRPPLDDPSLTIDHAIARKPSKLAQRPPIDWWDWPE